MRNERNDIHSPTNFDPAAYQYVGAVYTGCASSDEAWEIINAYLEENSMSQDALLELAQNSSFSGNFKLSGTCDHCGARFAYGAVYRHTNGDVIVVGHQCSGERFGLNSRLDFDMKKLHAVIKAAREQAKAKAKAEAYLAANPGLEAILNGNHTILADLKAKLYQWGSLSDKQVALAAKLDRELTERAARDAAEAALPKSPVIEGRIQVSGTILGFKEVEVPRFSHYSSGIAWKMILRDDRGFKLYGTMPSAVSSNDRGKHITFTATVEKSNRDEFFGFFKRPAKVEILEAACI
jgi:hypothetical protein